MKKEILWMLLLVLLLGCFNINAHAQLWQWSIAVKGGINKMGPSRAFMWIPPKCKHLRGVVLAQNNMEELSVIENKSFRDSMATINFAIVWVSPAFDLFFNVPQGAGKTFVQMMTDLAEQSGYKELNFAPVVPMGHSASANFPYSFSAWFPERTVCGVSISGIFPYDFSNQYALNTWEGRVIDYIPSLLTIGEYEGAGDSSSNFNKIFDRRDEHPLTPITMLPCAGEYHFATSQKKTDFIAYYIKKASRYRLIKDATANALAVLKPIDPTKFGWLLDRWRKNEKPRFYRAPVGQYTGIKKESFWCFDAEMASRIENYENAYLGKKPFLLAYKQNGVLVSQTNNHVQVTLKFLPLNDSLDFQLSSFFLDTVGAVSGRLKGWTGLPPGTKIGHPVNPAKSTIDRTIGPFVKTGYDPVSGVSTFRMQLEPGLAPLLTNYKSTTIFSLSDPGDAQYKPAVLQADMGIAVRNTMGLSQRIEFTQPKDIVLVSNGLQLNAFSDRGLPVQYFVREGPAILIGDRLQLTAIPPKAKYPLVITVVAWQWGRNADLAEATKGTNVPMPGQMIQTAEPVERTFLVLK